MGLQLSELYARFSFGLSIFTPKRTKLYMTMAMPGTHIILFGLWYCLIAVNLWDFHQITKWDSPEGWALIDRPTLQFTHRKSITFVSYCIHYITLHCTALHCSREPKMLTLKTKVLSCEKSKAEKSFGAKFRRQGKSCRAKSQSQRSPSAQNAEGKESPVVQKAEGREVLLCVKPKAGKSYRAKAEG